MASVLEKEDLHVARGVECSQCGANLLFNVELQAVACNFCGNALSVESMRRIDVVEPDFIVPFKTNAETFHDAALKWLVSGHYVPVDVLAKANFAENLGVYIPCVFYSGSFSADWSAQVGAERFETVYVWRNDRRVAERQRHIDYFPQNGRAHGQYAFVACASDRMDEAQKQFIESLSFAGSESFDDRLTLGFAMENMTTELSKGALFERRLSAKLKATVDQAVEAQISGDHVKDIRCSFQYSTDKCATFAMPVWLLPYEYEGERYAIIMDGRNSTAISGTKPQDETQKQAVRRPFYIAGALLILCIIGMMVAPADGVAAALVKGLFPASIIMGLGAAAHRFQLLRSNLAVRERALAAFQSNCDFDLDDELEQLKTSRWGPKAVFLGSIVAAFLTLVGFDTYNLVNLGAPQPTIAANAPATTEPVFEPVSDEIAPPPSDADAALNAADTALSDAEVAVDDAADAASYSNDAPEQPSPQSADSDPAPAAPAHSRPQPSDSSSQATVVSETMAEARRCFGAQNYDCAEANLKTVLRLDPSAREARSMLRQIAQLRDEAINSDWNAR